MARGYSKGNLQNAYKAARKFCHFDICSSSGSALIKATPKFYPADEVAQILNVAESTLFNWRESGKFAEDMTDHLGIYWYSADRVFAFQSADNLDKMLDRDFRGISIDTFRRYHCRYDRADSRIVIPTVLPDGNSSYVKVLTNSKRQELKDEGKVEGKDFKKVIAGKGTRGFFGVDKIVPDQPVLITEGEIDALSIIQAGYENVVGLGGTNNQNNLIAWLNNNPAEYQFVVLFDNDKEGIADAPEFVDKLLRAGYKAVSNYVSPPTPPDYDNKVDCNDVLVTEGESSLKLRINLIVQDAQVKFPNVDFPPPEPRHEMERPAQIEQTQGDCSQISQAEMKKILDHIPDEFTYKSWRNLCFALIDWGKSIVDGVNLARQFFIEKSSKDKNRYTSKNPNYFTEKGCIKQFDDCLKRDGVYEGRKITVASLIKTAQSNGYVLPLSDDLSELLFAAKNNDSQRADKIFAYCQGTLRYVTDKKVWALYNGEKWTFTPDAATKHLYPICRKIATAMRNSKKNGQDIKKAMQFENKKKIDAAIALIVGIPQALVTSQDFDKPDTAHLLNVKNGTVNLKTGELLPHNPEHYITHCANVEYDPNAKSALVDNFLQKILPDEGTRSAILRFLGYALTGSVTEESAMFARGEGLNGKSTLTKTLQAILGDYAGSINSDVLLSAFHQKDAESANPAVANLRGLRLVIGSDLKGGCKIDDSTIKRLCSRDKITARKLHENPIEFTPTHKLWISGQYYPELKNVDDNGVNRRLVLVEFTQTFDENNPDCDPHLEEKLSTPENKSALLNILVDNSISWYSAIANGASTGLIFSDAMNKTKSAYLDSQDWFMMAFAELFELSTKKDSDKDSKKDSNNNSDKLPLSTFRNILIENCAEARLLSSAQLNNVINKGLKKLGIEKKRSDGRNWVYGIKEINPFAGDYR